MLIFDAGFGLALALLQEEGVPRYVVRCATPATFCHARHTHDPCRGP